MSCESCTQRLDITLWGLWLQTVCKSCLPMGPGCASFRPKTEGNSQPTSPPGAGGASISGSVRPLDQPVSHAQKKSHF